MQYVGAGKVLFHATDETWRWRHRVGDVFFARYWIQAVRYLSRSKLLGKDHSVELAADRREFRRGEPVRLRVRFIDERQAPAADDGVVVVLEREGNKNQRISLQRNATNRGVFEGAFNDAIDGRYHAWIASPTLEGKAPAADFLVVAPPGELERVQMDAERVEASGRRNARALLSHQRSRAVASTICRRAARCPSKRCRRQRLVEQVVAAGSILRTDRVGMDSA